jgi:hypothetical protein
VSLRERPWSVSNAHYRYFALLLTFNHKRT